jgi:hypothetical protein
MEVATGRRSRQVVSVEKRGWVEKRLRRRCARGGESGASAHRRRWPARWSASRSASRRRCRDSEHTKRRAAADGW